MKRKNKNNLNLRKTLTVETSFTVNVFLFNFQNNSFYILKIIVLKIVHSIYFEDHSS